MSKPVVVVEGARELRRTLKAAGSDLQDLADANRDVAAYVATRAKSAAPHLTGRLAGSVRGNRAKATAAVKAGGASIPYAGPIHWGWPGHNISANPFLVDTAHVTEETWVGMYLDAVDKAVAKVRGK